jgi:hypothetical protein
MLGVSLILAGISQSQAAPTPPQANSIVISPTTIAPGGTVTVTFNVTSSSDIPVGSSSIVQFYAPSGANYGRIFQSTAGTPRNQSWTAQIQIPITAESGKYSLSISVPFDANGLSGGFVQTKDALTVTGSTSAPTPPKAKNILVSPSTIEPGGTVTVAFSVTSSSDIPVGSSSIVTFYAPSGANYGRIFQSSAGTPRDQSWTARIQIPATAETGNYSLSISIPFDANGLSGGFVQTKDAIWVGTTAERAAIDKAAADKIALDKATAEKIALDKAAAEKAAAEIIAKQEAEAKAAAELKAKQEAEAAAKTAADLRAKQEAEAKVAATKKSTLICTKGKQTKKVTAVKPKCPAGFKVKK